MSEVERIRNAEHRTRSELVREALRQYLAGRRVPQAGASPAELRAIRSGRAEISRGQYVTLDRLLDEMGRPSRAKSRKSAQARA